MTTDHSHPWCSQGEEDSEPVEEKKKHQNEKQSSANEHN